MQQFVDKMIGLEVTDVDEAVLSDHALVVLIIDLD
jgi:hypothetical protein